MKLHLDQLGSLGVVKDLPAHKLPPFALTDSDEAIFIDTHIERPLLLTFVSSAEAAPLAPRDIFLWEPSSLYPSAFLADRRNIYSNNAVGPTGTYTLRSSSLNAYDAGATGVWSGGILGGVPVLNNSNLIDAPQNLNGATFQNLTNWPNAGTPSASTPKWRCEFMQVWKNFLLAFNMHEDVGSGYVNYFTRMRWSQPADPGTVPTAWIPENTNLAGEYNAGGTGGEFVCGYPLGNYNILYKTDSVHIMQLTQGDQVFAFREVHSLFGCANPRGVAVLNGQHLVATEDDLVLHSGTIQYRSIIKGRLREHTEFRTAIAGAKLVVNKRNKEVLVDFGVAFPRWAWNYEDDTWRRLEETKTSRITFHSGNLVGTLFATRIIFEQDSTGISFTSNDTISGVDSGLLAGDEIRIVTASGTNDGTYEVESVDWSAGTITTVEKTITTETAVAAGRVQVVCGRVISGRNVGNTLGSGWYAVVNKEDNADSNARASNFAVSAERKQIALEKALPEGVSVAQGMIYFLSRIYPKVFFTEEVNSPLGKETDVLYFEFGEQLELNEPIVWHGPFEFKPALDSYIDVNIQGAFFSWRVYDDVTTIRQWRLEGFEMDVELVGAK